MKILKRIVVTLVILPIALFLLLAVALYIPPVQVWAVNTVASFLSDKLGYTVSVERVGLTPLFDLDLGNVKAIAPNNKKLLDVKRVVLDFDFSRVFDLQIGIDAFSLERGFIDSDSEIVPDILLEGRIGKIQMSAANALDIRKQQVMIECAALDNCDLNVFLYPTKKDTTESEPIDWTLRLADFAANDIHLVFGMDSMRIETRLDHASLESFTAELHDSKFSVDDADIQLDYLRYDSLSMPAVRLAANSLSIDASRFDVSRARLASGLSWIEFDESHADFRAFDVTGPSENFVINAKGLLKYDFVSQMAQTFANTRLDGIVPHRSDISLALSAAGDINDIVIDTCGIDWQRNMNLALDGNVRHATDSLFAIDIAARMKTFAGNVQAKAHYDNMTQSYDADIRLMDLAPGYVVKSVPVENLSGTLRLKGHGLDIRSASTQIFAQASVTRCVVRTDKTVVDTLATDVRSGEVATREKKITTRFDLGNVKLDATLIRRNLLASLKSSNRYVDGSVMLNCMMGRKIDANLSLDLKKADLYAMHLVEKPFGINACIHVDAQTDLKNNHSAHAEMNDLKFITPDSIFRPVNLVTDLDMRPDLFDIKVLAGGLNVDVTLHDGLAKTLKSVELLQNTLMKQVSELRRLDQNALKHMLPRADVSVHVSDRNPVSTLLAINGFRMNKMDLTLNSSPEHGLNGNGRLLQLSNGTVQLDTIEYDIMQDTTGVSMIARVCNGKDNPQISFDTHLRTWLLEDGAGLKVDYFDAKGRKGVEIGAVATNTPEGLRLSLMPLNPIVAYRNFVVNKDNYLYYDKSGRILANLSLVADDKTSVQLYSAAQLDTANVIVEDSLAGNNMQDITASFANVNLGDISKVMPYLPRLSGIINGDVHYQQQTPENMSVALDGKVSKFVFEDALIGDLGLNMTYMPVDDSTHLVDGILMYNDAESATFKGEYKMLGESDDINMDVDIISLPMTIVNGFVDKNLASASGMLSGHIDVKGSTLLPSVNGELQTHDVRVKSKDYNLNLRVEDHKIGIDRNYLDFNKIKVFSTGSNPMVLDGWIDFKNPEKLALDMNITTRDFELINAKRSTQSLTYGKVFCDADTRLRGTLDHLSLTGRLGVLGKTNVTYMMKDSPLTVDDRLSGLVTFVDFADSTHVVEPESKPIDIDMNLRISIDNATQVNCLLASDKSSYVNIEGGGDLSLIYNANDGMRMSGRYTINSGEMKYALPVIPLKTFKIKSGSYVAFNGKMLNPALSISASEQVRANVSPAGSKQSRSVLFNVGVDISKTLEDMGLLFTIEAPEDQAVASELSTMDESTRNRLAVTMLATGLYMSDTNTNTDSFNPLNTFLQSSISSIAGKALGSMDITFGMDNSTNASGSQQTDYSFRFAKHFFNNRVSVILGGTVSSGNDVKSDDNSIIDNVSIEYRLDNSATRYVRLYYDKQYESMIDGKMTEMGGDLVLRRKTSKLGELFIFSKKKTK